MPLCEAQTEDAPQGPTDRGSSLQQEPPQCAGTGGWSEGRGGELEQLEQYEDMELETRGWRAAACCEWPVLPPGVTVRSQPGLLLRAKSESVNGYPVARVSIVILGS